LSLNTQHRLAVPIELTQNFLYTTMNDPSSESQESSQEGFSRRKFLSTLGGVAAGASFLGSGSLAYGNVHKGRVHEGLHTGGQSSWPTQLQWSQLDQQVRGRLIRPQLAWGPGAPQDVFEKLKNPFYNEENPGATQSTGWLNAWESVASPYAVAAEKPEDIAAAVHFARKNRVRLVVKGTGHDYLGRSCAPDSLLVWTHRMRKVTVHDKFLALGAPAGTSPQQAITVEAGVRWLEAYEAATQAGRYVQGGGCTSVGACGGFTFGSGFGSFSKRYGTGAGGVLEVEVVTADGSIVRANPYQHSDLFFAMRGGGGGTFGIASKVTLLTHPIPKTLGILTGSVQAKSDAAYRELIESFLRIYPQALDNPHWGESVRFGPDNQIGFRLTFLDLPEEEGLATLEPFLGPMRKRPDDFEVKPKVRFLPFKDLWDPNYWDRVDPDFITRDPRADAPANQFWWSGNQGELSVFWSSYKSRWIPTQLLRENTSAAADAFFKASRESDFIFQLNKGLSGEHPEAEARDRQTAVHPQAFEAAALVIMASGQQYRYPGVAGREPDMTKARKRALAVSRAMDILAAVTPGAGSYSTESDYFLENWQEAQWGLNYPRLLAIKKNVDPGNLFRVHHGVGSEELPVSYG